MDLIPLADQSIEIVGNLLMNTISGAAEQVVTDLVSARMQRNPASAPAVDALYADPGQTDRRQVAATALRVLLQDDPAFANELSSAVQQTSQHFGPVSLTHNGNGPVGNFAGATLTAGARGQAIGQQYNENSQTTHNKKGGRLALMVAVGVALLVGGTTYGISRFSEETPEEKAKQTAHDFTRAMLLNDLETACQMISPSRIDASAINGQLTACNDSQAREIAERQEVSAERREAADKMRALEVEMPGSSTSRVIIGEPGESAGRVRVHLTLVDGNWRVTNLVPLDGTSGQGATTGGSGTGNSRGTADSSDSWGVDYSPVQLVQWSLKPRGCYEDAPKEEPLDFDKKGATPAPQDDDDLPDFSSKEDLVYEYCSINDEPGGLDLKTTRDSYRGGIIPAGKKVTPKACQQAAASADGFMGLLLGNGPDMIIRSEKDRKVLSDTGFTEGSTLCFVTRENRVVAARIDEVNQSNKMLSFSGTAQMWDASST